MYIAKGMYKVTEPQLTKFDALVKLLTDPSSPVVTKVNNTLYVKLKADGCEEFTYLYSTEFTPFEALKDAIFCHYSKFGIKLFQEIQSNLQ